jgi:NADPH2:quinone reductase
VCGVGGVGRAVQGRILAQVSTMVDEGYLKPMIDAHDFSLDQIADAHRWVESGQARGKTVLVVD